MLRQELFPTDFSQMKCTAASGKQTGLICLLPGSVPLVVRSPARQQKGILTAHEHPHAVYLSALQLAARRQAHNKQQARFRLLEMVGMQTQKGQQDRHQSPQYSNSSKHSHAAAPAHRPALLLNRLKYGCPPCIAALSRLVVRPPQVVPDIVIIWHQPALESNHFCLLLWL